MLARFVHAVRCRALVAMQRELEDFVVHRLRQRHPRPRRISINLDPSVDPTHGQQPFAYFNGTTTRGVKARAMRATLCSAKWSHPEVTGQLARGR